MSWMRSFEDTISNILLIILIVLIVACSIIIIDTAYHHYQEEHAQPASKGWAPPKIVKHENCALWDEIRKECEDD